MAVIDQAAEHKHTHAHSDSVRVIADLPNGAQVEQKSRTKFLPWPVFEPRTAQFSVEHASHQTTAHP